MIKLWWLLPILILLYQFLKVLPKMKQARRNRKRAELVWVRARIQKVESDLPLLASNVQNTARAEDYGSEAWQARVVKRSAEVKCDSALLEQLKAQEAELKKDLGIA